MHPETSLRRLLPPLLAFVLGACFTAAACGVLASQARLFSEKRDTAVMVGTQLPELKTAVALLQASVEAEKIFADQALAAREEQADAYVLPQGSAVSRAVSVVQETALGLGKGTTLKLQRISFDSALQDHGSVKTTGGTVILSGTFPEIATFLTVLGYGGDMMVRDVLPAVDQEEFLRQVEASAPLTLKAAEDFLYLDLVEYASDPDKTEQQLLSDVPTDVMLSVRSLLLQAGLASVRTALGPVAADLKAHTLWPLPLLRVDALSRAGNVWTVRITAFSR